MLYLKTIDNEFKVCDELTDEIIAIKTKMALDNNLSVILCIGEQLKERETEKTSEVNAR